MGGGAGDTESLLGAKHSKSLTQSRSSESALFQCQKKKKIGLGAASTEDKMYTQEQKNLLSDASSRYILHSAGVEHASLLFKPVCFQVR